VSQVKFDEIIKLRRQLVDMSARSGLSPSSRIMAFMHAIADILASFDCPECRSIPRELIDDELPRILDRAQHYPDKWLSTGIHVH
jgi:hypothetical protein